MGYHRAFPDAVIVGVDINPQPRYPFTFIQGDALTFPLDGFDLIHASPPCQLYSISTVMHDKSKYLDLVGPIRERLQGSDTPYVIENVPGAPLINWVQICGSGLGMTRIRRHRLFEANFPMMGVPCSHGQNHDILSVVGHSEGSGKTGPGYLMADKQLAMGIDWMNRDELSEAIPPAYTEYIGGQFAAHLKAAA